MLQIVELIFILIVILTSGFSANAQPSNDPVTRGFTPLLYPCSRTTGSNAEYHPLRPYPASPCDPLIPQKIQEAPLSNNPDNLYLTFTCNTSANPSGVIRFTFNDDPDTLPNLPANDSDIVVDRFYRCNGGDVCVLKRINFDLDLNFKSTRFPILGNTELTITDAEKVNNYLAWYLFGTIQQTEQTPLDPNNNYDVKRIIDYSGPLKKLLSADTQAEIRDTIDGNRIGNDYHNYFSSFYYPSDNRISNTPNNQQKNIPFSSLEDVTSEFTVSVNNIPQPSIGNGSRILTDSVHYPTLNINSAQDNTTDSRLYFPHLKSSNYGSEILSGLIRPKISPTPPVDPNDTNLVSQRITEHQGLDDNTQVERYDYLTGSNTRNTEIRPGQPAPNPLITPIPSPITCNQDNVRSNPGDRLVGSIVRSTLTYYQLVRFDPPNLRPQPCVNPGQSCIVGGLVCCYRQCNVNTLTCPRVNQTITRTSEARVALFTKTPLIEKIYFDLISSPQSVLRRFSPLQTGNVPLDNYIKVWPNTVPGYSDAYYSGDSPDLTNDQVTAGNETSPPQIYFSHIGSISDYFLGATRFENLNLQKMLRPKSNQP